MGLSRKVTIYGLTKSVFQESNALASNNQRSLTFPNSVANKYLIATIPKLKLTYEVVRYDGGCKG